MADGSDRARYQTPSRSSVERATDRLERVAIRVKGLVQGVGFRPHVHRLALEWGVTGHVLNDAEGVLIEAQGRRLDGFTADIAAKAPPLARIDALSRWPLACRDGEVGFKIVESPVGGALSARIGPDTAVCDACLSEMFNPADRRFLHPFITCTNCGPRFTISQRLPYDRARTTMAPFPLCDACQSEYRDPTDRRFHAEPIACPSCGPRLSMDPAEIAARLKRGDILALKGLGGYHLACDATQPLAVERLRERKRRDGKPFAVMVASVASARLFAQLDSAEAALMSLPERPIVLARSRSAVVGAPALAEAVSRGLPTVGLMLPYTPLQYLLFHALAGHPHGTAWLSMELPHALVMTSANVSGDPLVANDADAQSALDGIADAIVSHDRAIAVRTDDSVMRIVHGAPAFVRRARGFVPTPIKLARPVPPILAVGGHLKNTICLTRGDEAFVSQHVGDLDSPKTIEFLAETVKHWCHVLDVIPKTAAHDLHPDFASTRLAEATGLPLLPVQHHVAHVASVAAEARLEGPVLGLVYDGFGRGPKGENWGGELIFLDGARWRRIGHLQELALPGGDRAAQEPWRMAAAGLHLIEHDDEIATRFGAFAQADGVARLLRSPSTLVARTSSAGRWFDAVAALAGFQARQAFEGEAAMRLEAEVRDMPVATGGWRISSDTLEIADLFRSLTDLIGPGNIAGSFHATLIAASVAWIEGAANDSGVKDVVLAGGCFLNRVLAEGIASGLAAKGLRPHLPRAVPPNDGGLSLGQAWFAAMALEQADERVR